MVDLILITASVVTACLTIGGLAVLIIKWFLKTEKQPENLQLLKELHTKDMEEMRARESADIQAIKSELCVLSFGMLAALDGLMQLKCNGNVSKAHDRLEKHLNEAAHGID